MLLQMSRGQRLELFSANGRLGRLCHTIKVLLENRTLIRLRRATQFFRMTGRNSSSLLRGLKLFRFRVKTILITWLKHLLD